MSVAPLLAEPALYDYKGKEYKVHPWTYEVQGKFEQYLKKRAWEAYAESEKHLGQDAADRAMAATLKDIATGYYSFGSDGVGKALQAPEHVRYIFWLCLRKHDGAVTQEQVRSMTETGDDYQAAIRIMNVANTDPNLRAPREGAPQTS